jgi:hypothetical protein
MGIGAGAGGAGGSAVALTGLGGVALGAPIVHAAHGQWAIAFADLGMRVGAATLGGFVGAEVGTAAAGNGCKSQLLGCLGDTVDGLAIGAAVGAFAASVVDAAVLAREPSLANETPATPVAPAANFSWSPSVSMVKSGATAGLAGTF